jgi:hypothetical protein
MLWCIHGYMVTNFTDSHFFLKETPPPSPQPLCNSEGDSFEQSISKFNLQFTAVLVGLLDKISELGRENNNEKLLNVLYR